jgi:hypothetical protein
LKKNVEEITITIERVDEVPRTEFVGFFDRLSPAARPITDKVK